MNCPEEEARLRAMADTIIRALSFDALEAQIAVSYLLNAAKSSACRRHAWCVQQSHRDEYPCSSVMFTSMGEPR